MVQVLSVEIIEPDIAVNHNFLSNVIEIDDDAINWQIRLVLITAVDTIQSAYRNYKSCQNAKLVKLDLYLEREAYQISISIIRRFYHKYCRKNNNLEVFILSPNESLIPLPKKHIQKSVPIEPPYVKISTQEQTTIPSSSPSSSFRDDSSQSRPSLVTKLRDLNITAKTNCPLLQHDDELSQISSQFTSVNPSPRDTTRSTDPTHTLPPLIPPSRNTSIRNLLPPTKHKSPRTTKSIDKAMPTAPTSSSSSSSCAVPPLNLPSTNTYLILDKFFHQAIVCQCAIVKMKVNEVWTILEAIGHPTPYSTPADLPQINESVKYIMLPLLHPSALANALTNFLHSEESTSPSRDGHNSDPPTSSSQWSRVISERASQHTVEQLKQLIYGSWETRMRPFLIKTFQSNNTTTNTKGNNSDPSRPSRWTDDIFTEFLRCIELPSKVDTSTWTTHSFLSDLPLDDISYIYIHYHIHSSLLRTRVLVYQHMLHSIDHIWCSTPLQRPCDVWVDPPVACLTDRLLYTPHSDSNNDDNNSSNSINHDYKDIKLISGRQASERSLQTHPHTPLKKALWRYNSDSKLDYHTTTNTITTTAATAAVAVPKPKRTKKRSPKNLHLSTPPKKSPSIIWGDIYNNTNTSTPTTTNNNSANVITNNYSDSSTSIQVNNTSIVAVEIAPFERLIAQYSKLTRAYGWKLNYQDLTTLCSYLSMKTGSVYSSGSSVYNTNSNNNVSYNISSNQEVVEGEYDGGRHKNTCWVELDVLEGQELAYHTDNGSSSNNSTDSIALLQERCPSIFKLISSHTTNTAISNDIHPTTGHMVLVPLSCLRRPVIQPINRPPVTPQTDLNLTVNSADIHIGQKVLIGDIVVLEQACERSCEWWDRPSNATLRLMSGRVAEVISTTQLTNDSSSTGILTGGRVGIRVMVDGEEIIDALPLEALFVAPPQKTVGLTTAVDPLVPNISSNGITVGMKNDAATASLSRPQSNLSQVSPSIASISLSTNTLPPPSLTRTVPVTDTTPRIIPSYTLPIINKMANFVPIQVHTPIVLITLYYTIFTLTIPLYTYTAPRSRVT